MAATAAGLYTVSASREKRSGLIAAAIYAGSSEIQRNIIAARGLELPRGD